MLDCRVNQFSPIFLLILLGCSHFSWGRATVTGVITDRSTGETLIGVNVSVVEGGETGMGSATDINGRYTLEVPDGRVRLSYSFVGYESEYRVANLTANEVRQLDVPMSVKAEELNIVVVSGNQYGRKLEESAISIDVVGADLIANSNSVTLQDAVQKAPGVYMLDGQVNIRGGTGFTYGAGSRVQIVVDDQPLLTADRGDAKWAFIPMENVDQVEVIKGASSVLYGASALNGVIHVRTVWPGTEPETGWEVYTGVTGNPDSADRKWWDVPPYRVGVTGWHRQKFDRMDLVLGGHVSREITHLQGQENSRARLNLKTRFRPENNDRISYGFAANAMYNNEGSYLIWSDEDSGAYQPFGGLEEPLTTILDWKYSWFTLDPFLTAVDKREGTHRLKGRFYSNSTTYPDTTGSSWLTNLDYRYLKRFFKTVNVSTGFSGYYFNVKDGNLGTHRGLLAGVYFQVDKEFFNRLVLNLGGRVEFFDTDSLTGAGTPIFKAGLNYQAGSNSFIRASFGQGYRFPSFVERYSNTNVGALAIYPNDTLKAEYGYNAEIGYKYTLTDGGWKGYLDAALYFTEYFDMTEFVFGPWGGPPPGGLGFRTINLSRARMMGLELTASGSGKIGSIPVAITGGYNYVYPADLGADSSNYNMGTFLGNFVQGITANDSAFTSSVLKYRFRHTFRVDVEATFGKFFLGGDVSFYSFMDNIDAVFEDFGIPPGISAFRENHNGGDAILGMRVGYEPTDNIRLSFLVRNVLNREYALRVGKIDPPRSFNFQYRHTI